MGSGCSGGQTMKQVILFQPEKTIGHKIRMVSIGIDKYLHRRDVIENALPKGQGPMCGYLLRNQDKAIFQKDLEQVFHISGATASTSLKALEKNGLIARIPMEKDARMKRIVLTEKGVETEQRDQANILRLEEAMLKDFTPEERARFMSYMDRLIANVRELADAEEDA